jgi:hypothetical protein
LDRFPAGQPALQYGILKKGDYRMAGLIWGIIVILFIVWLLGLILGHLGGLFHLIIVVVVILLIYNLLTGRGARV